MNRDLQQYAAEIIEKEELLEQLMATKHALWMARAMWASAVCEYYSILANFDNLFSEEEMKWTKWSWVYHKCREKAKEFQ